MKIRIKTPTRGDLVYCEKQGAGIVTESFVIRKGQPRLLTVLFGGAESSHVYESEVKLFQRVERGSDGSVSVIFNREPS